MTDPLGQSQVLPYLTGLRQKGHTIDIISCEKPGRDRSPIAAQLHASGLGWHPLPYHKRPPILSALWDMCQMQRAARALPPYDLVHCRSYLPAMVGRRLGVPFLFDMRGFWADERVDGGLWRRSHPVYDLVYRYVKREEKRLLREAAGIVCLTERAREEIGRWGYQAHVIPCCSDLAHFSAASIDPVRGQDLSASLGLLPGDFVLSYLGSVGTWYLLDEMLAFFARLLLRRPQARLVFFTPDDPQVIWAAAQRAGVPRERLAATRVARADVPTALSLSRAGLYFIKPVYSKLASSPTKLGEILGMGLPVITNAGVGDSELLSERYDLGPVVREFTLAEYDRVAAELDRYLQAPPERLRAAALDYFSLERGVEAYAELYDRLGPSRRASPNSAR